MRRRDEAGAAGLISSVVLVLGILAVAHGLGLPWMHYTRVAVTGTWSLVSTAVDNLGEHFADEEPVRKHHRLRAQQ